MRKFKILNIKILSVLAVISLASCSAKESVTSPKSVETMPIVTVGTTINIKETESVENTTNSETEELFEIELPFAADEVTIEEAVIVDEAGIKITAKKLENSILGSELKLLIENNSEIDLTVQCRNASVNGYMVNTMISADVVSGKKTNDSITFLSSDFEKCGIENIADIEFSFHVFDSESWDTYLDTDLIKIKTSIAENYEYNFEHTGDLAYEGNNIKVIVKGLNEEHSFLGPSIDVYIENNSDKNVTVQTRDVSINGFMINAIFSSNITPGKHAVDEISFMNSELEENGIGNIEDIELSFHIFNSDNWETIIDTDVIKMTF